MSNSNSVPCIPPSGRRVASRNAFSLMELIVVMVIIGLLAGITGVAVRSQLAAAKRNAAKAQIAELVKSIETFYADQGRYPSNEEGLMILRQPTENYPEGFIKKIPVDPWKRPYVYKYPGAEDRFEVVCLGGDGREGGVKEAADIRNE